MEPALNAFAIAERVFLAAQGEVKAKGDADMRKILLIAALSLTTVGCGAGGAKAGAEAAVTQFHQLLDAARYHDIYAGTAPEFRNVTTEDQLTQLMQTIHDRLGAVGQANEQGWHYNYNNGVTRVDLTYNTSFASGTGTETFVYRIDNGRPSLLSYDIHSDALRGGATTNSGGEGSGDSGGDSGGK